MFDFRASVEKKEKFDISIKKRLNFFAAIKIEKSRMDSKVTEKVEI